VPVPPRSSPVVKSRVVGSFLQTGVGRPSQKISNYGSGRICGMPHCGTVLSAYNPALYCSLHDVAAVPRRRAAPARG
jgi:hypothetical protein